MVQGRNFFPSLCHLKKKSGVEDHSSLQTSPRMPSSSSIYRTNNRQLRCMLTLSQTQVPAFGAMDTGKQEERGLKPKKRCGDGRLGCQAVLTQLLCSLVCLLYKRRHLEYIHE